MAYTVSEDLDNLLSQNCSIDSWYDEGFSFAQTLLDTFTDDNWNNVISLAMVRDVDWNKRVVYCINGKYPKGLDLIRVLLQKHDDELREMCIDALLEYPSHVLQQYIKGHPEMMGRLLVMSARGGALHDALQKRLLRKIHAETS